MRSSTGTAHEEKAAFSLSGWPVLGLVILLLIWIGLSFGSWQAATMEAIRSSFSLTTVLFICVILLLRGFLVLQPNEAALLLLFGAYHGTVRRSGFRWTNPFCRRLRISLRARNLVSEKLKVNDRSGNPIEIAAVVVWRVADTAQATFDVESYEQYVRIQIESALRHLASQFSYDDDSAGMTLRGGGDDLFRVFQTELSERLARAGVAVDEARISNLSYAPEIAQAMLRRQQADAVIAARQKIVQGAVSMVEMALNELEKRGVVDFDPERRAAMVSNLLVVLCGESEAQPVINAGTLYH